MNEIHRLTWPVVAAHIGKEIEILRTRLESLLPDPRDTDVTRGEIRALRKLLRLPEDLAAEQMTGAPPGWPGDAAL